MIGVGIVGCGLIGRKRATNLPAEMQLRGVHRRRRRAGGRSWPTSSVPIRASSPPTSTTSLRRDDVDLVVVATVHDASR